jgi:flagellar protein FlbT
MEASVGLKIELKPGERVMLGECVITNDDQRTRLLVEGSAPILREKDIMTESRADTPAKRIYFAVQLMYISKDPTAHHELYFKLVRDITQAAPSMWPLIESINNQILTGDLYKALKEVKKLITYERELLENATRQQSIREHCQGDGKPA